MSVAVAAAKCSAPRTTPLSATARVRRAPHCKTYMETCAPTCDARIVATSKRCVACSADCRVRFLRNRTFATSANVAARNSRLLAWGVSRPANRRRAESNVGRDESLQARAAAVVHAHSVKHTKTTAIPTPAHRTPTTPSMKAPAMMRARALMAIFMAEISRSTSSRKVMTKSTSFALTIDSRCECVTRKEMS